jgi:glycosyltransferase involved in cell wall biosynthesis
MRILQLNVYGELGGIENFTRDTFLELESRGHRNILLYGGVRLKGLDRPGRGVYFWPRTDDFGEQSDDLAEEARRVIREERPDVALVHTPINLQLANTIHSALPTVYFAHNYGAFCPAGARLFQDTDTICQLRQVPNPRCLVNAYMHRCNTRRPVQLWRLYRRSARFGGWARGAEGVICDSSYVAERLIENGFAKDRMHILPSSVRLPATSEGSQPENIVLFIGRISPEKGLDYLVRAMPLVSSPFTLVVVGAGTALPSVVKLVHQLGLTDRVRFLGRVDPEAMGDIYAGARLLVVPSVWPEPFGMVGPEAMSHGLPVVAFGVGGISDWLLDGQTGFLVQPRDVAGLAQRIDMLLRDRTLAGRMGERGRELVAKRFTLGRHVDGLERVFNEAIERRRAAPVSVVSA